MPAQPNRQQLDACSNSLFDQSWWLDAVAPGKWSEVYIDKGGQVVARWPFVARTRMGFTHLTMPRCTPILGPALSLPQAKYVTRLSREKELLTILIDKLPPFAYFGQCMHYSMTNWLPFYWKGWSQTTRYTYLIEDLRDETHLHTELRENVRREIAKARRRLEVRIEDDIEPVTQMQELTFQRQGRALRKMADVHQRIAAVCKKREAGKAFVAVDAKGRTHAAVYVVWDRRSAYYLAGGGDPELRNSGAHSLVMWEAIRYVADVSQRFDFEGSMIEPIERFFRAFGARQKPYSKISHCRSPLVRSILTLRGNAA